MKYVNLISLHFDKNYNCDSIFLFVKYGEGGEKNKKNESNIVKKMKIYKKNENYFPSKFQHELGTPCPHRTVQLRMYIIQY